MFLSIITWSWWWVSSHFSSLFFPSHTSDKERRDASLTRPGMKKRWHWWWWWSWRCNEQKWTLFLSVFHSVFSMVPCAFATNASQTWCDDDGDARVVSYEKVYFLSPCVLDDVTQTQTSDIDRHFPKKRLCVRWGVMKRKSWEKRDWAEFFLFRGGYWNIALQEERTEKEQRAEEKQRGRYHEENYLVVLYGYNEERRESRVGRILYTLYSIMK